LRFVELPGGQSLSDVHVLPRAPRHSLKAAAGDHLKTFKTGAELVLVPVTVTDPMDWLVTGLGKNNFNVYEGKTKELIENLSSDDAPVSAGIILDVSGSMANKIDNARAAVTEFLKCSNPQDEFSLITFSDSPEIVSEFTNQIEDIQNKLIFVRPRGRTALLDAIYLGLSEMRRASNPRKALLIISDGGDNQSRYTESDIKSAIEESDVQVFAIGLYDQYLSTPEERSGPELLDNLTEITGGHTFTISNPNDLTDAAAKIGLALRDEYIIAYRPTTRPHDGKWHKIKVKLLLPRGLPPLHVVARTGYYAPTQ
jgi:Ca-activated chloride channel family protein